MITFWSCHLVGNITDVMIMRLIDADCLRVEVFDSVSKMCSIHML